MYLQVIIIIHDLSRPMRADRTMAYSQRKYTLTYTLAYVIIKDGRVSPEARGSPNII